MEGLHERFLVTVGSGTAEREFEVVPNLAHYAILENDVTIAELEAGDNWTQISGEQLPPALIAELVAGIEQHNV